MKLMDGGKEMKLMDGGNSYCLDPYNDKKKNGRTGGRSEPLRSCIVEFDGASKGNPGQAGAGAVLRADDGRMICRLREGLGIATCNAAEYRALILGMKHALMRGFTNIRVMGDSKLVCMQIQGLWKVRNPSMSDLYKEAKKLKDRFLSFEISHVLRDLNSDADAEANFAACLADGQIEEIDV